jgi:hypothetical protein
MATAVSTNSHLYKVERPLDATPEMIDVSTKVVTLLMHNNLISSQPTHREAFIQDYINVILKSFVDFSNSETRASRAQVRNTASQLALFADQVVTKQVIDKYAAFSGYAIVWDTLNLDVKPL